MKKIPIAVGLMVFGFFGIFIGYANSWVPVGTGGSILAFAGFFWFCYLWDKLVCLLLPLKSYSKRVRRAEDRQRDQTAYRDLRDKSIDRQLKALEKRGSQNNKGFVRIGDKVINFERKEA